MHEISKMLSKRDIVWLAKWYNPSVTGLFAHDVCMYFKHQWRQTLTHSSILMVVDFVAFYCSNSRIPKSDSMRWIPLLIVLIFATRFFFRFLFQHSFILFYFILAREVKKKYGEASFFRKKKSFSTHLNKKRNRWQTR